MKKIRFSEQDKNQIAQAIQRLEKESSGEIVPYFVYRSDGYAEGKWYSATLFAFLGLILCAFLSYAWLLPSALTFLEIPVIILVVMLVGLGTALLIPEFNLLFIGKQRIEEMVMLKAREAFLMEEVFNTRDRTGILIYVSQLERKVMIIGDTGISKKVGQAEWEEIVRGLVQSIGSHNLTLGMVNAIDACKQLLLTHGFNVRPDDTNELGDELRLEGE